MAGEEMRGGRSRFGLQLVYLKVLDKSTCLIPP